MTELEPLIKAFVKTLEQATTNTSDLTSMQFECFTPECPTNRDGLTRHRARHCHLCRRLGSNACRW